MLDSKHISKHMFRNMFRISTLVKIHSGDLSNYWDLNGNVLTSLQYMLTEAGAGDLKEQPGYSPQLVPQLTRLSMATYINFKKFVGADLESADDVDPWDDDQLVRSNWTCTLRDAVMDLMVGDGCSLEMFRRKYPQTKVKWSWQTMTEAINVISRLCRDVQNLVEHVLKLYGDKKHQEDKTREIREMDEWKSDDDDEEETGLGEEEKTGRPQAGEDKKAEADEQEKAVGGNDNVEETDGGAADGGLDDQEEQLSEEAEELAEELGAQEQDPEKTVAVLPKVQQGDLQRTQSVALLAHYMGMQPVAVSVATKQEQGGGRICKHAH